MNKRELLEKEIHKKQEDFVNVYMDVCNNITIHKSVFECINIIERCKYINKKQKDTIVNNILDNFNFRTKLYLNEDDSITFQAENIKVEKIKCIEEIKDDGGDTIGFYIVDKKGFKRGTSPIHPLELTRCLDILSNINYVDEDEPNE
jgi:hypothetical protein